MNKSFTLIASLFFGCLCAYQAGASNPVLKHRYVFENNSYDSIGGENATVSQAKDYLEPPRYVANKPSNASDNAPKHSIEVGMSYGSKKSGLIIPSGVFNEVTVSYSLWLKPDNNSNNNYLLNHSEDGLKLRLTGNGLVSPYNDFTANLGTAAISVGEWNHLVVAWDGTKGNVSFYVNGSLIGTNTNLNAFGSPGDIYLGNFALWNSNGGFSNQYDGLVYDLQVYEGELDSEQVTELFKNPGNVLDSGSGITQSAAFDVLPKQSTNTSVEMSAVVPENGGSLQYYFEETSGNSGGTSSGWQSSPTYIDTGLVNGTEYTYRVRMRDLSGNEARPSAPASVTVSTISVPAASAIQSGNWSDAATWGGSLPAAESDVTIPMGITVILDGDQECGSVTVMGKLTADPTANCSLLCDWVMVMGSGAEFEVGTHVAGYPHQFTLTLKGLSSEANPGGMGSKFLGAMNGGTIHLHGPERVSWTKLGATALAGAATLTLDDPVDWVAGEQIVITSTDTNWNHAEERVIGSVSGDGLTVTLTEALKYTHTGVTETHTRPTDNKSWSIELKAEVGLLSRNVKVQGDVFSDADGFGGHTMAMDSATTAPAAFYAEGVEFYRMGQTGVTGRYPVHWHLLTDQAKGQYVRNCSIHHSFSRAVTIHGTDYIQVEDNFCYDHIGHGIFLENGAERFNVIRNNVVLLTRRPEPGDALTPSDNSHDEAQNRTPASFWITNPNNTFEDNIAAGTEGTGFWFIFPSIPLEPAQSLAYYANDTPSSEPLGKFDRNTSHSCMGGLDINDKLSSTHSILANGAWDDDGPFYFNDCTWFSNNVALYAGIGGRKQNVIYYNNTFADNITNLFLATYQIVEESMLIADSGHGNLLGFGTEMYRVYDGAGQMRDNHMVGWDAGNATLLKNMGALNKRVNHRFSGFTWDHAGTPRNVHPNYDFIPSTGQGDNQFQRPNHWGQVIYDLDGSVGGVPDCAIIVNHPFMMTGEETKPDNWENNVISPYRFAQIRISNYDDVSLSVFRTKPGKPSAGVYYSTDYLGEVSKHFQLPYIVNDDFLYTFTFESIPESKQLEISFDDTEVGDHVLMRFRDFGGLSDLNINFGNEHNSLESLQQSTATGFYMETNGDLYLRPVSEQPYSNDYTISWGSAPNNWAALDSDGDGTTDGVELSAGTDAFGFAENENDNIEFRNANEMGNWRAIGKVKSFEIAEGRLKCFMEGFCRLVNTSLSFQGNSSTQIRIRYRNTSNGPVHLFWGHSDHNKVSASRKLTVPYSGDGDWQVLVFDLGLEPEWLDHEITRLRIDPNGSSGVFEVDYIRGCGSKKTDHAVWAAGWYGNELSDPWAVRGRNGLTNQHARLWGMDPYALNRVSPITQPLNMSNGVFSYTRRDVGLSGAAYSVWVSTNLVDWTEDTGAVQSRLSLANEVETMEVSLSPDWLNHDVLFIQVRAVE